MHAITHVASAKILRRRYQILDVVKPRHGNRNHRQKTLALFLHITRKKSLHGRIKLEEPAIEHLSHLLRYWCHLGEAFLNQFGFLGGHGNLNVKWSTMAAIRAAPTVHPTVVLLISNYRSRRGTPLPAPTHVRGIRRDASDFAFIHCGLEPTLPGIIMGP